jgi:valyl-tRNA synthetase
MRLLHPIMPFLTEEIWQRLPHRGESVLVAPWPAADAGRTWPEAVEAMSLLMEITREVRNIRSAYTISPGERVPLVLHTSTPGQDAILETCRSYLESLARLSRVQFGQATTKPRVAASAVVRGIEIYVPLEGVIDFEEERHRRRRELAKVRQHLDRVTKKLSNEDFMRKAPETVVAKERATQAELSDAVAKLEEGLARIEAFGK